MKKQTKQTVKQIEEELENQTNVTRVYKDMYKGAMDGWTSTLRDWRFWSRIHLLEIFMWALIGLAWGLVISQWLN